MKLDSPESPPNIKTHSVQPEERRQEQKMHAHRCTAHVNKQTETNITYQRPSQVKRLRERVTRCRHPGSPSARHSVGGTRSPASCVAANRTSPSISAAT